MVNIQRAEQNISAFIADDLVPKMPVLSGAVLATTAPFVIRAKMRQFLPMVAGTELCDGECVDAELIYRDFKTNMQGKWPVEIAGFKFYEGDLDKLYQYIMR